MKIGVIGAGNIGQALARLALASGHQVRVANSRGPESLRELTAALGCEADMSAGAAAFGDVVILAIPLRAFDALAAPDFEGKIVLDATNYYPGRDGAIEALDTHQDTTSGLLQRRLPGARVVKFFNAIMARDIGADAKPSGAPGRRALPIAGDDAEAKRVASELVDQFGYDPVDAGPLAQGWRFERAMPAYCLPMDAQHLRTALASAQRGVELPDGSWRARRALNQPKPSAKQP
jgi:8-hydroxy-5-deazaflavin:NADPH oxidoreductase